MSNNDSFIDEVSEELRRDRLYQAMRKYGWIAVVAVLVIVGGAAFYEFRSSQSQSRAQAFGDAVLAELGTADPSAADLAAIEADERAAPVRALLSAGLAVENGVPEEAAQYLEGLAVDGEMPVLYRDLAALKLAMTQEPGADRRTALEALAVPGRPFRLLAAEQLAYDFLAVGETEAAMQRLQAIADDAEATPNLRSRVRGVIVALGGDPDAAAGTGG
ncbi:hypothetical protein AADZ90_007735 [Aestuariibius sp. 2305UL40-4]|uniref:hypothetical protein n=1 Tax=Aestuariibius violaceus TaxID=3234132 RepID=UPI00345E3A01